MHLCFFIAGKNSCDLGVFFARKLGCVKFLANFMTERRCMENSTWTFYANGEPFSNELNRAKEIRKPRKDAKTFFLRTHNGKYKMWKQWKWKCERMPNIHKSGFLWFIGGTSTLQPCTSTKVGVSWKIWFKDPFIQYSRLWEWD